MATVELEREARNNRSVGTKDEDQDQDEALVRSSCREENHSTGGRRDDGRGVLAVCTLYLYGSYSTLLVRWGEIGSILIREKMVRWRIVRKGCSAIVTLLLCGAAACDFPDLVVRLPCCCSRCGSPPIHSSALSSKWRRPPEHRQWGRRRDRGLNLKQSTPLGSARLEEATAGQSGGQTTPSPGPMEHRA